MKKLTFLLFITVLISCNTHEFPLQEEALPGLEDDMTKLAAPPGFVRPGDEDNKWVDPRESEDDDLNDEGRGGGSGGQEIDSYTREYKTGFSVPISNFFNYVITFKLYAKRDNTCGIESTNVTYRKTAGYHYVDEYVEATYANGILTYNITVQFIYLPLYPNIEELDEGEIAETHSSGIQTVSIPLPTF